MPSEAPDLRFDELLARYLTEVSGEHHNLFAYPAQSFSGVSRSASNSACFAFRRGE